MTRYLPVYEKVYTRHQSIVMRLSGNVYLNKIKVRKQIYFIGALGLIGIGF
jgi:hypothetical protein